MVEPVHAALINCGSHCTKPVPRHRHQPNSRVCSNLRQLDLQQTSSTQKQMIHASLMRSGWPGFKQLEKHLGVKMPFLGRRHTEYCGTACAVKTQQCTRRQMRPDSQRCSCRAQQTAELCLSLHQHQHSLLLGPSPLLTDGIAEASEQAATM